MSISVRIASKSSVSTSKVEEEKEEKKDFVLVFVFLHYLFLPDDHLDLVTARKCCFWNKVTSPCLGKINAHLKDGHMPTYQSIDNFYNRTHDKKFDPTDAYVLAELYVLPSQLQFTPACSIKQGTTILPHQLFRAHLVEGARTKIPNPHHLFDNAELEYNSLYQTLSQSTQQHAALSIIITIIRKLFKPFDPTQFKLNTLTDVHNAILSIKISTPRAAIVRDCISRICITSLAMDEEMKVTFTPLAAGLTSTVELLHRRRGFG